MKIGITVIGDKKLSLNQSSVNLNDVIGADIMFKNAGYESEILETEALEEKAQEFDCLFFKAGPIINFGGQQSKHLVSEINAINSFKGPVVIYSVDQDWDLPNKERDGFLTIKRPVYFAYSGKNHSEIAEKQTKDVQVIKTAEFNQAYGIWKLISEQETPKIYPQYDAVYCGQARAELMPLLEEISLKYDLVTWGSINKKLAHSKKLNTHTNFSSVELPALNSLGKYSFLFFKPKTRWITPRICEQMASNSLVLFDKRWTETEQFWTEFNTFSSDEELMRRISQEPTKEQLEIQHEKMKQFNVDEEIAKHVQNIVSLIENEV